MIILSIAMQSPESLFQFPYSNRVPFAGEKKLNERRPCLIVKRSKRS